MTKKAAPNILNSAKPAGAVAAAAGGGGGGGGAASVDVADIRKITVSFPFVDPDEVIIFFMVVILSLLWVLDAITFAVPDPSVQRMFSLSWCQFFCHAF